MAWDDDKSTASDPDNPSASEQLPADEWNKHRNDQLSRMEYGPLSERPAASERPQGALWFDEYGRISRVDTNDSWVLDSFGTDANPIPDTSHFEGISTGSIDISESFNPDSLTLNQPTTLTKYMDYVTKDDETLAAGGLATEIQGDNTPNDLFDIAGLGQVSRVWVFGTVRGGRGAFVDLLTISDVIETVQISDTRIDGADSDPSNRSYSRDTTVLQLAIDDTEDSTNNYYVSVAVRGLNL